MLPSFLEILPSQDMMEGFQKKSVDFGIRQTRIWTPNPLLVTGECQFLQMLWELDFGEC